MNASQLILAKSITVIVLKSEAPPVSCLSLLDSLFNVCSMQVNTAFCSDLTFIIAEATDGT